MKKTLEKIKSIKKDIKALEAKICSLNAKIFDEYYIYDGPVFYMSDGSVVETDYENIMSTAHVSMSSIRRYDNEPFLYSNWSYDISGAVNTENIVKIEWNGVTIWEK